MIEIEDDVDINAMLADQGGRCAACETEDPGEEWVVDRSRETGRVRGILCRQCKTALTLANDAPEILLGWARHLEHCPRCASGPMPPATHERNEMSDENVVPLFGPADDGSDRLCAAHEQEGLRNRAEFRNFGWANDGDSITSKTTAGYLTSSLRRATGEVDHH